MDAIVFLGPSLPIEEAMNLLPAIYLPPAQQSDVLRALVRKPSMIGIIDGYFESVPSVWHKEILFAITSGVRVFGGGSMGALRAAELHTYGMHGVGRIFEWYRDGAITRDDEVAVLHAPQELGFAPLTMALVDIRESCASAVSNGVIDPRFAQAFIEAAAALHFTKRNYAAIIGRLNAPSGEAAALRAWIDCDKSKGGGLKARDARAVLLAMRDALAIEEPSTCKPLQVERTVFFEHLRREIALETAVGNQLDRSDLENLRRKLLVALFARATGKQLGWQLDADEVSVAATRLCAAADIKNSGELQAQLKERGIAEDTFWRFVNDELLTERLERYYAEELAEELTDRIHLRNFLKPSRLL